MVLQKSKSYKKSTLTFFLFFLMLGLFIKIPNGLGYFQSGTYARYGSEHTDVNGFCSFYFKINIPENSYNLSLTSVSLSICLLSTVSYSNTRSIVSTTLYTNNDSTYEEFDIFNAFEFNSSTYNNPIEFLFQNTTRIESLPNTTALVISIAVNFNQHIANMICNVSVLINYEFSAYYIEPPTLTNLLDLLPILIIIFIIPLVLYTRLGKYGFSVGLLLGTIIAIISGMIEFYFAILLIGSEITIIYFMMKKKDGGNE